MNTPEDAARGFVTGLLRLTLREALCNANQEAPAYGDVEAAVRRHYQTTDVDQFVLANAIRDAAGKCRDAVDLPLSRLLDAHSQEVTAKQQTAFLIGLEIGRAIAARRR